MDNINRLLTKSLLMKGFQCPKHLFLQLTQPDLAEPDKNDRIRKEGTEIGIIAQKLFPSGKLISSKNPYKALTETAENLSSKVLFEAAFQFENLYFRADVFEQTDLGVNIIEVKSSTDVKSYQIQDLSIQAYILSCLGFKINKLYICHVNREFTLENDFRDFFIIVDVTESVMAILEETKSKIKTLQALTKELAQINIGQHCNKPFVCPFKTYCYSQKNVSDTSILNFPNLTNKWELYSSGKENISDLTEQDLKTENQKKFFNNYTTGVPSFDIQGMKAVFSKWNYPLFFLDFETFDNVLPKYPKTKPNTKISYQFSVFKLSNSHEPILVKAYLADSISSDPRYRLAHELVQALDGAETIVSYNASFERSRIEEMANLIPELRKELLEISGKLVDLLEVVRNFVFYREFNGSWSIKSVVPVIFGESASYSNLNVKNGLEAQETFLSSVDSGNLDSVKNDLIEYCNKDVMEMIRLYLFLCSKIDEYDSNFKSVNNYNI